MPQSLYEQNSGSLRIVSPMGITLLISMIILSGLIIGQSGVTAVIGLIALPFLAGYFYLLFNKPIIGIYSTIALGFFLLGIPRYISPVGAIGMAMDGILILTYLALIFNRFHTKIDWKPAKKDITLLAAIWFAYNLMEVLNPEAYSKAAWLSGLRGMALYMMLIVPLVLILINNTRKIDYFLYLWGSLSILASLKGISQLVIGVDPWEKIWLNNGGAVTHVLFGKLRVFSFFSDAANFGANQGYTALVATIVGLAETDKRKKIFYTLVALLGFYGMVISGTRGAIAVPMAGFFVYFFLRKNKLVIFSGLILLALFYGFFKYTNIGQGNAQISRMRSAFDPNDPSLQVRLNNQKKLSNYLANRPLGGGIGLAGVKAQKYNPNAFLSNVATDSWFVMIWAEQGVVGLTLHLLILFYIVLKSSYLILFRIRDPILKMKMAALTSGMVGIMAASYGNEILGTMPTGMIIYTSMALMLNAEAFDHSEEAKMDSTPVETQ